MRILQLFKHQHGELREPQLAGQEQADRAGPCDDHVVDQGVLLARVFGPGLRPRINSVDPRMYLHDVDVRRRFDER